MCSGKDVEEMSPGIAKEHRWRAGHLDVQVEGLARRRELDDTFQQGPGCFWRILGGVARNSAHRSPRRASAGQLPLVAVTDEDGTAPEEVTDKRQALSLSKQLPWRRPERPGLPRMSRQAVRQVSSALLRISGTPLPPSRSRVSCRVCVHPAAVPARSWLRARAAASLILLATEMRVPVVTEVSLRVRTLHHA